MQDTANELRISDWSSYVCSSSLFPRPHIEVDDRYQHGFCRPGLQHIQATANASSTAGQHDYTICFPMRFKRLGQEEREPGKTQQPAQQNKCEKAADHNDRLNAQSTVSRAVSIASKTPPNGSSKSTPHP